MMVFTERFGPGYELLKSLEGGTDPDLEQAQSVSRGKRRAVDFRRSLPLSGFC